MVTKPKRKSLLVAHGSSGGEEWWFALVAIGKGALSMQVVSGVPCRGCAIDDLLIGNPPLLLGSTATFQPCCAFMGLHLYFPTSIGQRRQNCALCPGGRCFKGEMVLAEGQLFWQTHGDPAKKTAQAETFWTALEMLFVEMLAEAEEKRVPS